MGNLRIKLKYKSFEIELEGENEIVQTEFKDIKENGLGNIVMGIDMSDTSYVLESNDTQSTPKQIEQVSSVDYIDSNIPSFKDVLMKQLPSSEREWILVYAFYGSEYCAKPFTSKTILEAYESSKRKTTSRHANMSQNIKALFNKGYFSALNDEEFLITEEGKNAINEIIKRTNPSSSKSKKPISKDKATKTAKQPIKKQLPMALKF